MNPILLVLVFIATALAVEGAQLLIRNQRRADSSRVRRRLRVLAGRLQAGDGGGDGKRVSILRQVGDAKRSLSELLLDFLPNHESLELLMYRAGSPLTPQRFFLVSGALAVGGFILALALVNDQKAGFVGLLLGVAPWLALRKVASRRMQEFEAQFPDALELMTRAMRAGHALGVGFQLVSEEMADPIGSEFGLVAEEIRFGLDVRQALMNLTHRVECGDLPFFTTAVIIQRETGGNLAELLDKLGGLVRERAKFHGKVRALTSQGRLAATLLALWPGITVGLLAFLRPDYIQPMFENPIGHLAMVFAAVLIVVGYVIARRMATVESQI